MLRFAGLEGIWGFDETLKYRFRGLALGALSTRLRPRVTGSPGPMTLVGTLVRTHGAELLPLAWELTALCALALTIQTLTGFVIPGASHGGH